MINVVEDCDDVTDDEPLFHIIELKNVPAQEWTGTRENIESEGSERDLELE